MLYSNGHYTFKTVIILFIKYKYKLVPFNHSDTEGPGILFTNDSEYHQRSIALS